MDIHEHNFSAKAHSIGYSAGCFEGGDGYCDGSYVNEGDGEHEECRCPCHITVLPSTIAGVKRWHDLYWQMVNSEGE